MAYEIFETCMLVPGFTRSECASWVQAWGSIGAIVGAFALSYNQIRAMRKETLAAEHRRLMRRHNAIVGSAYYVERVVHSYSNSVVAYCHAPDAFGWASELKDLEMARDELALLRATEMESYHLVEGVRRLAVALENARIIDDELLNGSLGTHPQAYKRIEREARLCATHAQEAIEEIYNAINELMEDPGIALPPGMFQQERAKADLA